MQLHIIPQKWHLQPFESKNFLILFIGNDNLGLLVRQFKVER
jgi:hypothetical protein